MKKDVLSQGPLGRSHVRLKRLIVAVLIALSAGGMSLQADPALGDPQRPAVGNALLTRVSQGVVLRYWLANPAEAPAPLQERFRGLHAALSRGVSPPAAESAEGPEPFNQDGTGLPQNEESVTVCPAPAGIVLGGTNDFRGLLDPQGNFTGWHLSTDNGASVANEGLLPAVEIAGQPVPSGGDPVVKTAAACTFFAGSLNVDPVAPFERPNGVGVYRSDLTTLATCPGGAAPACWPTRRAVATAEPPHFLDKEWLDVGDTGDGVHVWVVYTDFLMDQTVPAGFTSASIMAVRCEPSLRSCTAPILISGTDQDVQFGDVTIGPDQRTYITWSEIQGELEQTAQTFIHKLRIAPAGSTTFGPTRVVATEPLAIPFGGRLHANDFRIATYPKNEVALLTGQPRTFVVWEACFARLFGTICEEPQIKLTFSDDDGVTWSAQTILSAGGDNYFPTIATDRAGGLAVAWYTNRFDPQHFHSQQDVELVWLDPSSLATQTRVRVTPVANETQADPLLGGSFIGDYIEVAAQQGTAYVHYNANYRQVPLLGRGVAIPQQDNFLTPVPASLGVVEQRE
jgi:hypothetical protein